MEFLSKIQIQSVRPKWMRPPSSKSKSKVEAREMVNLPKSSILSTIPAELQMDIIFYLSFHDALNLKSTCRYYNFFITDDILEVPKQRQIEMFKEMDRTPAPGAIQPFYQRTVNHPKTELPCYTCLRIKPAAEFYNIGQRQYCLAYKAQVQANGTERYCIPCGFKTNRFEKGLQLTYKNGTETMIYCITCNNLVGTPVAAKSATYNNCGSTQCYNCSREFDTLSISGGFIRVPQFGLSIIIFALACTGKAVPRSSVVTSASYRFIITALTCLLTAGGAFASMIVRGTSTSTYYAPSIRRSDNMRFVFLTEFSGLLAWAGCMVAMINEGHRHKDRFDSNARAAVALELLEIMLFFLSACLVTPIGLRFCAHGRKGRFPGKTPISV